MSKRLTLLFLFVTAGLILLGAAFTIPVQAQADDPNTEANACLTCHSSRYYNFDSGRWFCMCAQRNDRCTACHGGNPETHDPEEAHIDLVVNPLADPQASCGQCHDDVEPRVAAFVEMTGVIFHEPTEPQTGDYQPVTYAREASESRVLVTRSPIQIWGGFGLALVAVVGFGIACYQCRKRK
ncbi:MAG: hypothetical protein JXB85_01690 [Anaerolineales bacterium]|nr:hypothetical protein [Anaerolineales bacterium]